MITLLNPTPETLNAEIDRLTKINEEAEVRILDYRANHANASQVKNAREGVNIRNEKIAELRAALV